LNPIERGAKRLVVGKFARQKGPKSAEPLRTGGRQLTANRGGSELPLGQGAVGSVIVIGGIRLEHVAALEVARHAPHRLLEHLADFTGSAMSELLPCERCTVLIISSVEKNCAKMRIASQVTRRALLVRISQSPSREVRADLVRIRDAFRCF
jgi:hypothetical protein